MGSNKKETRLLQKAKFEELLKERKAFLLAKGVHEKKLQKDKVVKHLQAELNRTVSAIVSIEAREKVIKEAATKKQRHAEEKAVKPKSKKKEAETESVEKDKGKKKKKKEKKEE